MLSFPKFIHLRFNLSFFYPHQLPGAAEPSFLLLTASTQSFLSHKDSSELIETPEMKRGVPRSHKGSKVHSEDQRKGNFTVIKSMSWTWPSTWPCSPKSQLYLGLHQEKCNQQVKRGDFSPLLHSPDSTSVQIWGSLYKKDVNLLQWVHRRHMKRFKVMEHFSYKESLRELRMLSGEEKPWRDFRATFQYLKWASKKDGDRLSSRVCCGGPTMGNGLKEGWFLIRYFKKVFQGIS